MLLCKLEFEVSNVSNIHSIMISEYLLEVSLNTYCKLSKQVILELYESMNLNDDHDHGHDHDHCVDGRDLYDHHGDGGHDDHHVDGGHDRAYGHVHENVCDHYVDDDHVYADAYHDIL